jgi:hypothetical protein
MVAFATLVALLTALGSVALVVRPRARDDVGPSVREYAAFRAALSATGRARHHVRV